MSTAYKFGRHGGHVGGHLRDAFADFIEGPSEDHFHDDKQLDLQKLTGLLWNCTDIMQSWCCSELEMPLGSTYARAVRKLRSAMN